MNKSPAALKAAPGSKELIIVVEDNNGHMSPAFEDGVTSATRETIVIKCMVMSGMNVQYRAADIDEW